jgi:hypothetical protein
LRPPNGSPAQQMPMLQFLDLLMKRGTYEAYR